MHSAIQHLTLTEGIRRRPAMYVGSTDARGLHHLIGELLDNAINAYRHGTTRRIEVTLYEDTSVTVEHDGDGVSISPEAAFGGRSYLEVAFTETFAGGGTTKAAYDHDSSIVFIVPALAETCEVESFIDGHAWRMQFQRGEIIEPLTCVGPTSKSGLRVRFRPDPAIFPVAHIDGVELRRRVRELAALEPDLTFVFHDELLGHDDEFHFPAGVQVLLHDLLASRELLLEPLTVEARVNRNRLSFAAQYQADADHEVRSFANRDGTRLGGVHVRGCLLGLRDAIRTVARTDAREFVAEITLDRITRGLRAVAAIELAGAQFEGPTKEKLGNAEVERWCRQLVTFAATEQLESSQAQWTRLLAHLKREAYKT